MLSVDMPVSAKPTIPYIVTLKYCLDVNSPSFSLSVAIRRTASSANQFKRRKVVFTLTLHRGMFHSAVVLGQAKLPLAELLTCCRTGGDIPLTDISGKRGIGGFIKTFASLRSPVSSPNGEVRVSEERELIIGQVCFHNLIHRVHISYSRLYLSN